MAKKKKTSAASKKAAPRPKGRSSYLGWIIGGVVVVIVLGALALAGSGSKNAGGISDQEKKYIGRFLPPGYEEPTLGSTSLYSSAVKMTKVTATQSDSGISIPLKDLVTDRIVFFEYQKAGSKPIPLLAYVKPSGKLFVGVSYCPPCQGEGQRIEADGTLTCESCGTKRSLETQAGLSGACKLFPLDELPGKVAGDRIVVDKGAVEGWTPQPIDRPVGG